MVARDYFDHTSPGGETVLDRIKASTYLPPRAGYILGENIALGTMQLATPAAIVASWMKSPGHRANILNGRVPRQRPRRRRARRRSGTRQGQRGATYTQQFGAVSRR